MSGHGTTKEKILRLIAEGSNNLTQISDKLSLAPSTVSKHLHDLESTGMIEEGDNHTRKWKYYRIKEGAPNANAFDWGILRNKGVVGAGALAVFAILAFVLVSGSQAAASGMIPISITDPPSVPVGTQALYINYSSLRAHVAMGGRQSWIDINSSGRLDLMGLVNVSQVIGGVNVSSNSIIDAVAFNISSASITVDNVTYPVYIMSKHMVATVQNKTILNPSSGVLLDFSPVVIESNASMFVMIPSVRAVITQDGGVIARGVHSGMFGQARFPLPPIYRHLSANGNITVSNPLLSFTANSVTFGASLTNTGSKNITVLGIVVESPAPACPGREGLGMGLGGCQRASPSVYHEGNGSVEINDDAVHASQHDNVNGSFTIRLPRPVENISIYGVGRMDIRPTFFAGGSGHPLIAFAVESNGTLAARFEGPMMEQDGSMGYPLGPGASRQFSFQGSVEDGALLETPGVVAVNGTYRVAILTNDGLVTSNVTAT